MMMDLKDDAMVKNINCSHRGLRLVPNTHTGQLTAAYNSTYRYITSLMLSQAYVSMVTNPQTIHILIFILKNKIFEK